VYDDLPVDNILNSSLPFNGSCNNLTAVSNNWDFNMKVCHYFEDHARNGKRQSESGRHPVVADYNIKHILFIISYFTLIFIIRAVEIFQTETGFCVI
jgi:hypothetical protein